MMVDICLDVDILGCHVSCLHSPNCDIKIPQLHDITARHDDILIRPDVLVRDKFVVPGSQLLLDVIKLAPGVLILEVNGGVISNTDVNFPGHRVRIAGHQFGDRPIFHSLKIKVQLSR